IMKKYYYKDISWDEFQEIATSAFAGSLDNFTGIVSVEGDNTTSGTFGISISNTIYNEHIVSFIEPNSSAWNGSGLKCDIQDGKLIIEDEDFKDFFGSIWDTDNTNRIRLEEGDSIYGIIPLDLESADEEDWLAKQPLYRVENANAYYMSQIISGYDDVIFIVKKYDSKFSDGYYAYLLSRQESSGKTAFYYNHTDDVGIIKVLEFSENTTIDFAQCVLQFIDDGNKKLILDLRNNGGGNSTTLEYMAQFLLNNPKNEALPLIKLVSNAGNGKMESNLVYSSSEDYANPNNPYEAFPIGNRVEGFEVVVLCNGNSASASEALIGALQYYNNAKIVGAQTYGKGVAQKVFVLSNGNYLYVTNGTYYVPTAGGNGKMVWEKCIHGEGFTPLAENIVTDRLLSYDKDACTQRAMELFTR
ncbi:MAG: S41 family peptidase, partial [Clostridia bacterium]|nr:S41 family peptidase [Clostridia bacterium]